MWCTGGAVATGDRCFNCGNDAPLPLETEGVCVFQDVGVAGRITVADPDCSTRNNANDPNFVIDAGAEEMYNLTLVAEVCTVPYTGRIGLGAAGVDMTYKPADVASWCESCVRTDGTVDPSTLVARVKANLAAMGPFDNATLIVAAFVVAFIVVGELKDILLCSLAIAHAGERLSKGWRLALGFMLWMR